MDAPRPSEHDFEESLIGEGADDDLAEQGAARGPVAALFWRSRRGAWAVALALLCVAFGVIAWRSGGREVFVPLAVPSSAAAAAGQAAAREGVEVQWRDGHPWVAAGQIARATQAATAALASARGETLPATSTDEGLFLSADAARARRLAGTARALEQMIEAQSGVERARVVLAEGARPGAPGAAYAGPTAAVTVVVTEGTMSQDLVDAVAALVGGAIPGLAPERVAVIDANANRQRMPREPGERAAADARRERERALAEQVRAAVAGASEVRVSIGDAPDGRVRAVVVLGAAHARRVAAGSRLPADVALATEEARVTALAEALLPAGADGAPAAVVVTHRADALDDALVERTPPAEALAEPVMASIERERVMPLGAAPPAAGAWDGGMLALLALGVGGVAAVVAYAQRRAARVPALAGGAGGALAFVRGADAHARAPRGGGVVARPDPLEGVAEASDAVRADPEHAVLVVRGWLDGGYDLRAAHVVVALDSGAAGALLRAMPAPLVHRITAALASLETPTVDDLREASAALVEEIALAQEAGGAGPEDMS